MPNLGMMELLILAFLGLLIFGKKLPEVGKSIGQGIVQFKKGLQGVETQVDDAMTVPEPKKKKKKKKALEGEPAAIVEAAGPAEPAAMVDSGAVEPVPSEKPAV